MESAKHAVPQSTCQEPEVVLGCRGGDAIGSGCRSAGKDDIYGRSDMTGLLSVDKRRLAIGLACTVIRFLAWWWVGGWEAGGRRSKEGPRAAGKVLTDMEWAVSAADEDPFPTSCHLRGLTSDGPGPSRLAPNSGWPPARLPARDGFVLAKHPAPSMCTTFEPFCSRSRSPRGSVLPKNQTSASPDRPSTSRQPRFKLSF